MSRTLCLLVLAACAPSTEESTDDPVKTPTPTSDPGDPVVCTPPARQVLADIPDVGRLSDYDGALYASFEVDGDELIGKHVVDATVAEGALTLWQELVLRIPLNQRAQLVQFTIIDHPDLAAYVDNVGTRNQTGRYGPSIYLNASNIEDNDPDVCAPLTGHRGTYDWTLIHEFGHLRQYADGTVDDFVETFGTMTGDGEGYPTDGSPSLDGMWVTSYAERAGGDEDAAESFTTYVMLDTLPEASSIAGAKVGFFEDQPDYAALRQALRVTEPGGGGTVPDAPLATYELEVDNPDWMWGTWEGTGPNGPVTYVIDEDDLLFRDATGEMDYAHLRDDGTLAVIEVVESVGDFHYHQVSVGSSGFSESFYLDDDGIRVEREDWGDAALTRVSP